MKLLVEIIVCSAVFLIGVIVGCCLVWNRELDSLERLDIFFQVAEENGFVNRSVYFTIDTASCKDPDWKRYITKPISIEEMKSGETVIVPIN